MSTFGVLKEFVSDLYLRPATAEERDKSRLAAEKGYPKGCFATDDGKLVYVEEASDEDTVFVGDDEDWAHEKGNESKGDA